MIKNDGIIELYFGSVVCPNSLTSRRVKLSIEEPLYSPYDWQLEITDARIFAGRRDELNGIKDELLRLSTGKHLPLIAVVG